MSKAVKNNVNNNIKGGQTTMKKTVLELIVSGEMVARNSLQGSVMEAMAKFNAGVAKNKSENKFNFLLTNAAVKNNRLFINTYDAEYEVDKNMLPVVVEAFNTENWGLVADLKDARFKGIREDKIGNIVIDLEKNYTITSRIGVNNIKKRYLRREDNRSIYSVVFNQDGTTEIGTVAVPENKAIRLGYFPAEESIVVMEGKSVRTAVNTDLYPFTKSVMVFELDDLGVAKLMLNGTVYVVYNASNTMVLINDTETDGFINVLDNSEVERSVVFEVVNGTETKKANVSTFNGFGYSPSKLRNVQILLVNMDNGEAAVEDMINELTSGAYGIVKGKEVEFKDASKITARMFNWLAPSNPFPMKTIAFLNGNWVDRREGSVDKGEALGDGVSFIYDVTYAAGITELTGVTVAPWAVTGRQPQVRPYETFKNSAIVVERAFIEALMSMHEVVRFTYDEITPDMQKEIMNDKDGKYAGKIIIIGEDKTSTPDFYSDRNGLKADYEFCRRGEIEVLDDAMVSQASTSIQMIEKPMKKDQNATLELLHELSLDQTVNMMSKQLFDRKPSIMPIKSFNKLWATQVVQNVAPTYAVTKDQAAMRNIVDNMVRSSKNANNKLKYNIDGSNLRLISDIMFMLNLPNILHFGEFFCKDANNFANKKIKEFEAMKLEEGADITALDEEIDYYKNHFLISAFKYPTMGEEEFILGRPVSLNTIETRIDALDAPVSLKTVAKNFYRKLGDATIVVPAMKLVMQLLAGMDFDFDGAAVVYNRKFNAILAKDYVPFIVNIVDDYKEVVEEKLNKAPNKISALLKNRGRNTEVQMASEQAADHKYLVSIKMFVKTFIENILNGNKSVGEVTNMNSTNIALGKNLVLAREVLKKAFKQEGHVEKYVGFVPKVVTIDGVDCDVTEVNKQIVDKIVDEMISAKLTDENIKKIFNDLNIIFRFLQETIIDAAKKGTKVEIRSEICFVCWALSLTDFTAEIDWTTKTFNYGLNGSEKKKKNAFENILFRVKKKFFAELGEFLNEEVIPRKVNFTNEELNAFTIIKKRNEFAAGTIADIKYIFNAVVANYIQQLNNAAGNEELEGTATKLYRARLSVLANMVRVATAGMTPAQRGMLLKAVAMSTKGLNGTLREDGGSKFADAVCPEEYIHYILDRGYAEVDFAGSKLVINKAGLAAGDMVTFTAGIACDGEVLVMEDIDGEFEIKEFEGSLYATKSIKELIAVPTVENTGMIKLQLKSIQGRVKEVMDKLSTADRIRITSHGKDDYHIYVGEEIVCGVDNYFKGFKQLVDGIEATPVELIVCDVKDEDKRVIENLVLSFKDATYKPVVMASENEDGSVEYYVAGEETIVFEEEVESDDI